MRLRSSCSRCAAALTRSQSMGVDSPQCGKCLTPRLPPRWPLCCLASRVGHAARCGYVTPTVQRVAQPKSHGQRGCVHPHWVLHGHAPLPSHHSAKGTPGCPFFPRPTHNRPAGTVWDRFPLTGPLPPPPPPTPPHPQLNRHAFARAHLHPPPPLTAGQRGQWVPLRVVPAGRCAQQGGPGPAAVLLVAAGQPNHASLRGACTPSWL